MSSKILAFLGSCARPFVKDVTDEDGPECKPVVVSCANNFVTVHQQKCTKNSPAANTSAGEKVGSVPSVASHPILASKDSSPEVELEYASSCYFPTTWLEVPLLDIKPYSHDTKLFEFGLPEDRSLDLPVCACVLLRGFDPESGKEVVRPYTPCSDNSMKGKFQLLIKAYEKGTVSRYVHGLQPGDMVGFKHIKFNIKSQYPFGKKTITMLCAGTGITPMFQALHKLVKTEGDDTQIVMLYGNRTQDDILMADELREMEIAAGGRFKLVHVLSQPKEGWKGETGRVDKALVSKYAFMPADDTMVMVCGLPAMYKSLCGPREEKALLQGSALAELGYDSTMVAKF